MHMPFRYDFFYVLILSVIYLFEPGVASVTNAYRKKWAGLGWAGLPLFHQKRLPAGFVRKTHFPKKHRSYWLLALFGLIITSHTFDTCHLSTVRSHPASTPTSTSSNPTKIASEPHISCLNCSPYKMLKCNKKFFSLSVAQVQVQKTWFVEEAYIWSWSQVKAEKSEK